MTLLVLTFGEITPKSMAKEMPETLAMGFAPALSALVTIFTPLNALFGAWKSSLPNGLIPEKRTPSPRVSW